MSIFVNHAIAKKYEAEILETDNEELSTLKKPNNSS